MRFGNEQGHYELNPFPGCAQLVVSNHAFIKPDYREVGHGQKQHAERLDKMQELGYDYALCTIISTNSIQRHIAAKNGWRKLDQFTNSETNNTVEIWGRMVGKLGIYGIEKL
jgi:L-amino acid N-acyltransferase YncA